MRRHPRANTKSGPNVPNASDRDRHDRPAGGGRKTAPPEQTNAENFYYQKQMQSKTPMVIVLRDGEEIHGMIEWYDKSCLKVARNGQTNLLIYKPAIKYMFKEGEKQEVGFSMSDLQRTPAVLPTWTSHLPFAMTTKINRYGADARSRSADQSLNAPS